MIMEIREDGITIVEVKNKQQLVFLASAVVEVLKNVPEVQTMVILAMENKLDFERDLGLQTQSKQLTKSDDPETIIKVMKINTPAHEDDIPDFVKRSVEGKENE